MYRKEECIIDEIISICDYETKVFNENEKLQQQLQAYKDKEDKLRELIDNYIHDDYGELYLDDILDILNEGE